MASDSFRSDSSLRSSVDESESVSLLLTDPRPESVSESALELIVESEGTFDLEDESRSRW